MNEMETMSEIEHQRESEEGAKTSSSVNDLAIMGLTNRQICISFYIISKKFEEINGKIEKLDDKEKERYLNQPYYKELCKINGILTDISDLIVKTIPEEIQEFPENIKKHLSTRILKNND